LHNHATGADGEKIGVLRKGPASLEFIRAAPHRRALEINMNNRIGKRIKTYSSDLEVVAEIATYKDFQKLIPLTFIIFLFVIVGPYLILFRFSKLFSELSWSYLLFFAFLYFGAFQFFPEWLWSMFGKEIITISSDNLKHKRSIFGISLTRNFDKGEVQDIWASGFFEPERPIKKYSKKFGLKLGAIAIDYSGHSYRFGIRLKEKEAIDLAIELKNFLTNH